MKHDRLKHILSGLGASLLVSIPDYVTTKDLFTGLWVCLWVGIIVGLVKEWCDMRTDKWDWLDFVATCIGAVIVAVFIVAMHFGKG